MKSLLIHSNVEKIYFLIEDEEFPYELPPEVECINVSNQQWFSKENCPQMNNRCSYMVLLRVVFCQIFPHLDRILTIDNDTIVRENISELWDLDLDNYYIAGCLEPKKSTAINTYINMGVAMINLKKWREDHLDEQLVENLKTYYYEEAEQTAINEVCQGHTLILDPMYNRNNYTFEMDGKQ
jgi:lipopolysaccharide biosynthesis glycosyltransferase